MFSLANLEKIVFHNGGLKKIRFGRLERFDYSAALAKGVGFCSQQSLALVDILNENNVDAYMVGLFCILSSSSLNGLFQLP